MNTLALLACVAFQSTPTADVVSWETIDVVAAAGDAFTARIGRFEVPEDHARPDGPKFTLAFAHYPSTAAEPGPPIYFLVGGPGASATEFALEFTTQAIFDLRAFGDVIALDQRGTGLSEPNIADEPAFPFALPLDAPSTRESLADAHAAAALACIEHWRDEAVEARVFTTVQSAHDVDMLRRALGHEKIVVYGVSYGTHLGIEYLRSHGAHVERALLSRVEGPDDTYKLPSSGFAVLETLAARVAKDPAFAESLPDLVGTLKRLADELEAKPVTALVPQRGGEPLAIVLGPHDLQLVVASTLGDSRGQAFLPALVEAAARGDWSALGHFALGERAGEVSNAMGLLMDGASSASAARFERIEREAQGSRFVIGDALNAPYLREASHRIAEPSINAELCAPFVCEVPVLLVSGAMDGRTPPANAEALRARFPRSAHLVFTNTAHDARELEDPQAAEPLRAFLRGEPVSDRTIELEPLPFVPPRR
jgi:pimeloyl-ACP methyl ester carboxylesterase